MTQIENRENFDFQINMNLFASSLIDLMNLFLKKADELCGNAQEPPNPKFKHFIHSCNLLKNGFSDDKNNFDTSRVTKKVYKTLTEYIDHIYPEQNVELFYLRDENKKIITIIPGVDIGLVVKQLNPDESKGLWGNLYMIYISAANVIAHINKFKKVGKIWTIIPKLKEKVIEYGIVKNKMGFTNPFIGINTETGEYDVKTMFANLETLQENTGGIPGLGAVNPESLLKMVGFDKMFNMKDLTNKLKDIKPDEIKEQTRAICKEMGVGHNSETGKLFENLATSAINKLQNAGDNPNFGEVIGSFMGDLQKIDPSKMMEARNGLFELAKKMPEKLKNMKDDNGNPINDQMMKQMQGPLQMLSKMMGK